MPSSRNREVPLALVGQVLRPHFLTQIGFTNRIIDTGVKKRQRKIRVVRKLNMKTFVTIFLSILLSGSLSANTKCGDDQQFNPFHNLTVYYLHINTYESIKPGVDVNEYQNIGTVQALPKVLTKNDAKFEEANKSYAAGQYDKAAKAYIELYQLDKTNKFVINGLARTYYKMPNFRGHSIRAYLDLMRLIDETSPNAKSNANLPANRPQEISKSMVIDPWFIEAYWKLGTLHLDYEEYEKAIIQMSKIYFFEFNKTKDIVPSDRNMALQLFSYLAEAYYRLDHREANQYFYCRAKEIDPKNSYVDRFQMK